DRVEERTTRHGWFRSGSENTDEETRNSQRQDRHTQGHMHAQQNELARPWIGHLLEPQLAGHKRKANHYGRDPVQSYERWMISERGAAGVGRSTDSEQRIGHLALHVSYY